MPLERPVTLSLLAAIALAAAPVVAGAQPRAAAAPLPDLASLDARLGELSRRVAPSVVQVMASGYTTAPNALLARAGSSGSGVIVDAEGWIVTNAHVVESARSVRVDVQPPRAPPRLRPSAPSDSRTLTPRTSSPTSSSTKTPSPAGSWRTTAGRSRRTASSFAPCRA